MAYTVEEVFYSVLSGSTSVTGITGTRIYPAILPEDITYPAVVLAKTAAESIDCIGSDVKLGRATMSVVALSTSIATASSMSREIRDAIMGTNGNYTHVIIKEVFIESGPRSEYDATLDVHLSVTDYSVFYQDT